MSSSRVFANRAIDMKLRLTHCRHQTGRLRIVRRVRQPQDVPRDPAVNPTEQPPAPMTNNQSTMPAQAASNANPSESRDIANAASSSTASKKIEEDSGFRALNEKDQSAKLDLTPTPGQEVNRATTAAASFNRSSNANTASSQTTNTSTNANTSTTMTGEQAVPTTSPPPAHPQQQGASTWRHVEHGILTFIASLIPTPPPENEQLEANAVPVAERAL